jgi:hypothetical protein
MKPIQVDGRRNGREFKQGGLMMECANCGGWMRCVEWHADQTPAGWYCPACGDEYWPREAEERPDRDADPDPGICPRCWNRRPADGRCVCEDSNPLSEIENLVGRKLSERFPPGSEGPTSKEVARAYEDVYWDLAVAASELPPLDVEDLGLEEDSA